MFPNIRTEIPVQREIFLLLTKQSTEYPHNFLGDYKDRLRNHIDGIRCILWGHIGKS